LYKYCYIDIIGNRNTIVYRTNIVDVMLEELLKKGYLMCKSEYVLKMETLDSLYYWIFVHKIDAEVAKKKIGSYNHIDFSENHDFANVNIHYKDD
jgi:hypothetical protein